MCNDIDGFGGGNRRGEPFPMLSEKASGAFLLDAGASWVHIKLVDIGKCKDAGAQQLATESPTQ
jgi:hypothetical protein